MLPCFFKVPIKCCSPFFSTGKWGKEAFRGKLWLLLRCIPEEEKSWKRCNKTGVARAVQKGTISLMEMETLAVEGIAWVQKEPFESIKCFISCTEQVPSTLIKVMHQDLGAQAKCFPMLLHSETAVAVFLVPWHRDPSRWQWFFLIPCIQLWLLNKTVLPSRLPVTFFF